MEKFENGAWPHPTRLPLGAGWRGHCTAAGHEGESPSQPTLEAFCNLGYAGSCQWSPAVRPFDAVRFAVCAPPNRVSIRLGAEARSQATVIHIRYVCEKDHLPVESGELGFDLSAADWPLRHPDPRIQKMAECFMDSYLRVRAPQKL